jgi:hypothetical protein
MEINLGFYPIPEVQARNILREMLTLKCTTTANLGKGVVIDRNISFPEDGCREELVSVLSGQILPRGSQTGYDEQEYDMFRYAIPDGVVTDSLQYDISTGRGSSRSALMQDARDLVCQITKGSICHGPTTQYEGTTVPAIPNVRIAGYDDDVTDAGTLPLSVLFQKLESGRRHRQDIPLLTQYTEDNSYFRELIKWLMHKGLFPADNGASPGPNVTSRSIDAVWERYKPNKAALTAMDEACSKWKTELRQQPLTYDHPEQYRDMEEFFDSDEYYNLVDLYGLDNSDGWLMVKDQRDQTIEELIESHRQNWRKYTDIQSKSEQDDGDMQPPPPPPKSHEHRGKPRRGCVDSDDSDDAPMDDTSQGLDQSSISSQSTRRSRSHGGMAHISQDTSAKLQQHIMRQSKSKEMIAAAANNRLVERSFPSMSRIAMSQSHRSERTKTRREPQLEEEEVDSLNELARAPAKRTRQRSDHSSNRPRSDRELTSESSEDEDRHRSRSRRRRLEASLPSSISDEETPPRKPFKPRISEKRKAQLEDIVRNEEEEVDYEGRSERVADLGELYIHRSSERSWDTNYIKGKPAPWCKGDSSTLTIADLLKKHRSGWENSNSKPVSVLTELFDGHNILTGESLEEWSGQVTANEWTLYRTSRWRSGSLEVFSTPEINYMESILVHIYLERYCQLFYEEIDSGVMLARMRKLRCEPLGRLEGIYIFYLKFFKYWRRLPASTRQHESMSKLFKDGIRSSGFGRDKGVRNDSGIQMWNKVEAKIRELRAANPHFTVEQAIPKVVKNIREEYQHTDALMELTEDANPTVLTQRAPRSAEQEKRDRNRHKQTAAARSMKQQEEEDDAWTPEQAQAQMERLTSYYHRVNNVTTTNAPPPPPGTTSKYDSRYGPQSGNPPEEKSYCPDCGRPHGGICYTMVKGVYSFEKLVAAIKKHPSPDEALRRTLEYDWPRIKNRKFTVMDANNLKRMVADHK